MKYFLIFSGLAFSSHLFAQVPFDMIHQFIWWQAMEIWKEMEQQLLQQLQKSEGIINLQNLTQLSWAEKHISKELQNILQQSWKQELLKKILQSPEAKKILEKSEKNSTGTLLKTLSGVINTSKVEPLKNMTGNISAPKIVDPLISFKNQIKSLPQTRLKLLRDNLMKRVKDTNNKKLQQQLQDMEKHVQSLIKNY